MYVAWLSWWSYEDTYTSLGTSLEALTCYQRVQVVSFQPRLTLRVNSRFSVQTHSPCDHSPIFSLTSSSRLWLNQMQARMARWSHPDAQTSKLGLCGLCLQRLFRSHSVSGLACCGTRKRTISPRCLCAAGLVLFGVVNGCDVFATKGRWHARRQPSPRLASK